MEERTAILLMAYGSPNSLDEVGEYLRQVRGGRLPTDIEVQRLRERYRRVGGKTPLFEVTMAQAIALQRKLDPEEASLRVYVGMKHWHPFIQEVIQAIARDNSTRIVGLALAPYYSELSIGGYEDAVHEGIENAKPIPFTMVQSWHNQPHLIDALTERVRTGLAGMDKPTEAVVLFAAHSLPKRFVSSDDPYESQLRETSQLVADKAGISSWDFAFQSGGEPADTWLGPMIKEKIAELSARRFRELLVCPVGFVSDHLEILYDIDIEAKEYASSLGVRLTRTSSLNDDPELIEALADTVKPFIAPHVAIVSPS